MVCSRMTDFYCVWLERDLACRRLLDRLQTSELVKKLRRNERKRKNNAGQKPVSGRPTLQSGQAMKTQIWQVWFPAHNRSRIGSKIWTRRLRANNGCSSFHSRNFVSAGR